MQNHVVAAACVHCFVVWWRDGEGQVWFAYVDTVNIPALQMSVTQP